MLTTAENIEASSLEPPLLTRRFIRLLPIFGSSLVVLASVIVLCGWQYRVYLMKTIPGQTTVVAPNTAVCFILSGISILLLSRQNTGKLAFLAKLLGGLVFAFAALTLVEHLTGVNLGIDEIVFRHRMDDWPVPTPKGRFAIQTAFGFTFVGAALMLLDRRIRSMEIAEPFIAIAGFAPLVGMLGYIYQAKPMHGVMAGATIIIFFVLWISLVFLRPNHGAAYLLLSNTSGGIAARRLITSTTLLLIVSGWVRIEFEERGYTDLRLGTALFVTWVVITVILLIFSTARGLDKLDHERESASRALAESLIQKQATEDRLHEGLEAANAGIWDMNLVNGELYWSKCHFTLLGYEVGEVIPTFEAWRSRVHPEDLVAVEKHWHDSIRDQTLFAIQYRVVWPDGSTHWVEAHGRATYDEDNKPIRSIGGFVDITERKKGQVALMEAEKIAVTGRMAATLAHEINNPLAAVTNLLYLLKSTAVESPEVMQQYLQVADDEIRRVAQLVQKTLSFYRADVRPVRTNISDLMDEIIWLYKNRIRDSGVRVEKEESFDGEITCNSGEIRQVLTNIFVNAVEAVGKEGRIIIRIHSVAGFNGSARRGVRVWIHDDGSGIPEKIRPHLFKPFTSMKGDQGTGLGLWISKGIIEKNGGSIRFRTNTAEHHGTCFSVFIPDRQDAGYTQAASSSLAQRS